MNDLNKIINKAYAESLQTTSMPYIAETIGYKIFNKVFDLYKFQLIKTDEDKLEVFISKFPEEIYSSKRKIDNKNVIKINSGETIENIIKNEHPWSHSMILPTDMDTIILGNGFYFNCASCSSYTYNLYIQCDSKETAERLSKYIAGFEETKEIGFNYITIDNQGYFSSTEFKLPESITVPLSNYNSDFPWKELKHFCENENPGIFLLYGEPGCGKSYCIRKLIQDCNTTFYVLDANILNSITSSAFIDYLMDECSNCVLILEDCEKLLMDRNTNYNPFLSTILNLSDGLLGDGLKLKFICTFNTNIQNIDSAVLRKGRLVGKYEFKKLSVEQTNQLCDSLNISRLNKESTLAEVYNSKENDFSKKQSKKIGFV